MINNKNLWYITINNNNNKTHNNTNKKLNEFRKEYKIELNKYVMMKIKINQLIELMNENDTY